MFSIPEYVIDYDIDKFCLPTVQYDPDTGKVSFFLPVQENLSYRINDKNCHQKVIVGGYDLGRVKPFVLTVMTDTGKVIARRQPSARLRDINDKRERILAEKKVLVGKIRAYDELGIRPDKYDVYVEEIECLGAKAKALGREVALLTGAEIAGLCEFHGVDVVAGETLNWVNDVHGSSRWVHGMMQESIAHAVRRSHVKHFTVSARDTSRTCPKCSSKKVRYDSGSRVITCDDCGYSGDRDDIGSENVTIRRAKVQLRQRVKELLAERASSGDVLSAGNSRRGWCPDCLAGNWELAVGSDFGLYQAFLSHGNTVLFWSRPSVLDYIPNLINNRRTSKL